MKRSNTLSLLVAAAALAGCEFVGSGIAPSVTGGAGSAPGAPTAIVPLDAAKLGQPSGTSAGIRIAKFRSDLAQLQHVAVQEVQRGTQLQADMDASIATYQIAMGTIDSNRQAGANTVPVDAWRSAQAQLQTISSVLDRMNGLSSEVAKNVAFAAFLGQSIREANAAPDATDQDRQQLKILEASTTQTATSLDQLLGGLRQQVLQQSRFLGTEGAKLAQIAPPGAGAPVNAALSPQPPVQQSAHVAGPAGAGLASGRPFVVIRFDDPGVEYEQQLYEAVSAALARSPNVGFDLIAAAPEGGTAEETVSSAEAARASMERVRQSLLNMGLPTDRVSISQLTDPAIESNEVRLYVR
ncbi:MAG TPA: hypothetical protein VJ822_11725 [Dongiaceae bacterium]|nr:hypothetical protein [Dongiaceae bacterium]